MSDTFQYFQSRYEDDASFSSMEKRIMDVCSSGWSGHWSKELYWIILFSISEWFFNSNIKKSCNYYLKKNGDAFYARIKLVFFRTILEIRSCHLANNRLRDEIKSYLLINLLTTKYCCIFVNLFCFFEQKPSVIMSFNFFW